MLGGAVVIAVVTLASALRAQHAGSEAATRREDTSSYGAASPRDALDRSAMLDVDDSALPDDTVLREQLEKAIELRRREHFDRVLDAREPGELIEHATLTDVNFDHHAFGADTLFVVGDELFGYLFRPENGWGSGSADRKAIDYTPQLRRVHRGAAGGPDSFGCFSCHSKGGPDGAGTQTQNAFLRGDGERIASADQRNPPHLLGVGPIAALAREMSAELGAEAAAASERARAEGRRVERDADDQGRRLRPRRRRARRRARHQRRRGRRSRSDRPALRLEGTPGDAAWHRRGVAPHPSRPALEPHSARGARRHPRSRARTEPASGTTSTTTASRSRSTAAC